MAQMSREPSASTPTEGLELRGPIGGYFVWWEDIIFREELGRLGASSNGPKVNPHADDEPAARMERLWAPVQRTGP
jgi:hypothetical protein